MHRTMWKRRHQQRTRPATKWPITHTQQVQRRNGATPITRTRFVGEQPPFANNQKAAAQATPMRCKDSRETECQRSAISGSAVCVLTFRPTTNNVNEA